jgi:hypothetical protein
MNEQTQIDADNIAVEAPPPADVPMTIAAVEDLMRWRADPTRKTGDSFVYYAGSSPVMRERSRDIAVDQIAATVRSMYESDRVVPMCRRNGQGMEYLVQAVDNDPVPLKV